MKEIEINAFAVLHDIIETYDARTIMYRGMKSVNLPLMPKVGRVPPPQSLPSREANEKEILRLFKERALHFLDYLPSNVWDWLALVSSMASANPFVGLGIKTRWWLVFLLLSKPVKMTV